MTRIDSVHGRGDDATAVNELRAALTATFERIVYQPVWEEVPAGAPVVCGKVDLAPVLRSDLLYASDGSSAVPGRARRFDWLEELLAPIPVAVTS